MAGGDGGAGPGARHGRRWDVALSFAGAQRPYVEQVAAALQARGLRCFYDADEQIELWGRSLAEELPRIYAEESAAVVVFVSAEYADRDWTRLERRAALDRAVRERREYVLPARFDDTPLPGLLPDVSYVDLRAKSPQQFAAMIADKLAALGVAHSPTVDSAPGQYSGPSLDTAAAAQIPRLVHTLTGHTGRLPVDSVSSVAFSPDGRLLASGGDDKTVRLWDPATGTHLRTLTGYIGHTGCVWAVAFSPDGRLLASCGNDGVRLWDPATGIHQRTLTGHSRTVASVAFSPDGRLLASCGNDGVRLWDPATGAELGTLTGHTREVSGVAFNPDGRLLASGGYDETVRLWDRAAGAELGTLAGHTAVQAVAFSPDGRLLASCGNDKKVRLWDLPRPAGS